MHIYIDNIRYFAYMINLCIYVCLCVYIGIVNHVNTNGLDTRDQKLTIMVMMMKTLKCMSLSTQCTHAGIGRSVNDF